MPRKKTVTIETQVYKLPQFGPHAKVTVEYDPENAPPFFQPAPGVVIVGDHVCAAASAKPVVMSSAAFAEYERGGEPMPEPRGGNFGFDEGDPSYQALRDRATNVKPGPRPVLTSEDVFRDAGIPLTGPLDVNVLAGAAAASTPIPSEG